MTWTSSSGAGERARHVAFVLGTTAGGTGTHVRMLAAGCAARGMAVTVLGPSATAARLRAASRPGMTVIPVEFGDRPRPSDAIAVLRLRRVLRATTGSRHSGPDVVHVHGLRAGALTVLALGRLRARRARRGRRWPALVATVHNAPPSGGGAPALVYRLLERLVAHGADLVLCVSGDLEARMRAAGAPHVRRAVVPPPVVPPPVVPPPVVPPPVVPPPAVPPPAPASATARPVVLAAGRLTAQKGFSTMLEAAARWRDLDPEPLLVIAGDGPLSARLRAKAASLGVAARFLGHHGDVAALLARAAVFVLPSLWEGQPLVLQEALRAGVPIVASRAGGIPDLTAGAALLVPPGDAARLAAAVRSVLGDPALAARLRDAARHRAAGLPSEADAVAAAVACYAEALRRPGRGAPPG